MKVENTPCRKCGGITQLKWIPSGGMDVESTGLKKTCIRCGFSEFVKALDEQSSPLHRILYRDEADFIQFPRDKEILELLKDRIKMNNKNCFVVFKTGSVGVSGSGYTILKYESPRKI